MKAKQLQAEQPLNLKIAKNMAIVEANEFEYFSKKVADLDI